MKRNPSPAWFRKLQLRGDRGRAGDRDAWFAAFVRRTVDSILRTARGLHPDMRERELRLAAAALTLDAALLGVLDASEAHDDQRFRSNAAAQEAIDAFVARVAPVVDAQVETLLGRWRGAKQHTTVGEFDARAAALVGDIENERAVIAGSTWSDQLVKSVRRITDWTEQLRDYLVEFDGETSVSFLRLGRKTLDDTIGPLGIVPTPRRKLKTPDELADYQRRFWRKQAAREAARREPWR